MKSPREPRPNTGPTPIGQLLPAVTPRGMKPPGFDPEVAAALIPLANASDADHLHQRVRREISRWLERTVEKALWRAERRTRRVPWHVGRGIEWVMGQRRQIAYEVLRPLLAHGAGDALARRLAELAAMRFPRDGIVVDDREPTPRLEGTNPRAVGTDPRTNGRSPRQRGRSPRQLRGTVDERDAKAISNLRGAD